MYKKLKRDVLQWVICVKIGCSSAYTWMGPWNKKQKDPRHWQKMLKALYFHVPLKWRILICIIFQWVPQIFLFQIFYILYIIKKSNIKCDIGISNLQINSYILIKAKWIFSHFELDLCDASTQKMCNTMIIICKVFTTCYYIFTTVVKLWSSLIFLGYFGI